MIHTRHALRVTRHQFLKRLVVKCHGALATRHDASEQRAGLWQHPIHEELGGVDFGLVKVQAPEDARTITVVQGKGTIMYTPLEQYGGEGGHTDARTDIYALGATLYTLLTDFPPPHAKARFLNPNVLQSPRTVNSKLSRHVSNAVMWAIEMHPDDRPSSVREFQDALQGKILHPSASNGETAVQGALSIVRANWIAAIIAVLLFIAAVIFTIL